MDEPNLKDLRKEHDRLEDLYAYEELYGDPSKALELRKQYNNVGQELEKHREII